MSSAEFQAAVEFEGNEVLIRLVAPTPEQAEEIARAVLAYIREKIDSVEGGPP